MEPLKKHPYELKEHFKERKRLYEEIAAKKPSRALVLANIYVNIKYMGNKYPKELEEELRLYVPNLSF